MNKKQKQRKKWLKRRGLYISPRDTWNLDTTIAEFILPRLKLFKKLNNGYPGKEEMDTPEKWDEALDKMILAFQYLKDWEYWWFNDPKYDYFAVECSNDKSLMQKTKNAYCEEEDRRQQVIEEGLQLFAKWYQHLWW